MYVCVSDAAHTKVFIFDHSTEKYATLFMLPLCSQQLLGNCSHLLFLHKKYINDLKV